MSDEHSDLLNRISEAMNGKAAAQAEIERLQDINGDLNRHIESVERDRDRLQKERDFYMRQATELVTLLSTAADILRRAGTEVVVESKQPTLRKPPPPPPPPPPFSAGSPTVNLEALERELRPVTP